MSTAVGAESTKTREEEDWTNAVWFSRSQLRLQMVASESGNTIVNLWIQLALCCVSWLVYGL